MDRDDMRVREAGRGAGLTEEALAGFRLPGELGRQHLDGDVAIQLHFPREGDHPHAAPAELALERVLTRAGGLESAKLGGGMAHPVIVMAGPRERSRESPRRVCGL